MKKIIVIMAVLAIAGTANAATEQAKQQAIDDGLAWLASTQATSGSQGYWPYANSGTLAATGSAALAFIEEGYLPGADVVINGTNYGDVVGNATNYIFNRATADTRYPSYGTETAGYTRIAEDYDNSGAIDAVDIAAGANNQAIYFNPGSASRNVYTTGVVAPVVYALGEALGVDTEVGVGSVTSSMTYGEVMQDVIDWYSWGQVEPTRGTQRGGWRYDANYSSSDNSTAQWGSLPSLYGENWGLETPQYVRDELGLWTDYIQNDNGGSGYSNDYTYVNVAKTGGLLVQFSELGYDMGVNNSDSGYNTIGNEVDAALDFIDSRWNTGPSGVWYGNLNHPYAMWAVYKGLAEYGLTDVVTVDGGLAGTDDDYDQLVGFGMSNAPGGITIGQEWSPTTSAAGDWYSHYCDLLVGLQNSDGSWTGYPSYFTGALATGWYINILNATGTAEPIIPDPVPVPGAFLLGSIGLAFACRKLRRRKEL